MPPRRVLVALGVVAILACVVFAIVSRREAESPEAQIRRQLERAAHAAEEQDLGGVMAIVSERYPDRDEAKRVLFAQLRSAGWRRVVLLGTEVELDPRGDKAKARFDAVLAKGESKDGSWRDLAPSDATVYRFELVLEKEEEWRVVRGSYARASLRGGP